jgi:hypothetical protein
MFRSHIWLQMFQIKQMIKERDRWEIGGGEKEIRGG